MIHKQSLYILHQGNRPHICYKNYDTHNALDCRLPCVTVNIAENKVGDLTRQPHKEEECQNKADNAGNNADNRHHLWAEMIRQPAVELRHFLRSVILKLCCLFGGLHQTLVSENHLLNKAYRTSYERNSCKFIFIFKEMRFLKLRFDFSVGQSQSHCDSLGAVHHNALHQRLSADADFIFFRHLHFPPLLSFRFQRLSLHRYPIHPQAQHDRCQSLS